MRRGHDRGRTEAPFEAIGEVEDHRRERQHDGGDRLGAQLRTHLGADRAGPLEGVRAGADDIVEGGADGARRRLGVVEVRPFLGGPGADHEFIDPAELLDLGVADPLLRQPGAHRADVDGLLRGDVGQRAAGELDAVVEPPDQHQDQAGDEDDRRDDERIPASANEIDVRVREECAHDQMLSSAVEVRFDSQSRKKVRTTKIAETIEASVPTMSVTAKPRTGPVPNW